MGRRLAVVIYFAWNAVRSSRNPVWTSRMLDALAIRHPWLDPFDDGNETPALRRSRPFPDTG